MVKREASKPPTVTRLLPLHGAASRTPLDSKKRRAFECAVTAGLSNCSEFEEVKPAKFVTARAPSPAREARALPRSRTDLSPYFLVGSREAFEKPGVLADESLRRRGRRSRLNYGPQRRENDGAAFVHRDAELVAKLDVRQIHEGGIKDDALGVAHFGNGLVIGGNTTFYRR